MLLFPLLRWVIFQRTLTHLVGHYCTLFNSLSQDENFKAAALEKIGNIMVNAATQGQDFIARAQEHNFYNYDLVDAAFTSKLLGDSGSECDL
ncbi:hypothetical protein [Candidatus Tisiphia endosymbiont of Nedyus quadrimaculatus]|uniref:hypothetical protein n=1 Tax=Candidatus Tisiphia endosymbiont of Nedyus quadrimaculatus TaxID=3139332 RepID=UPI00345EA99E